MLRAMSEIDVKLGLKSILQRIEIACEKRNPDLKCLAPRLVAVSKTKPPEMIIECYDEGQKHFGENYVQELVDKSANTDILDKCKDIRWHFIGHLQTNKINKVLAAPNLYMIETVDSEKLARNLNKNWPKFGAVDTKLRIMIQVNTSGEKEKSGIDPNNIVSITKFVLEECTNLELDGIMTIGQFGYDCQNGPNPDFLRLIKCRQDICDALSIEWQKINLSMGMSDDFEHAIELGSTNVRVGSSIFGYRPKKTA